MKKLFTLLMSLVIVLASLLTAYAEEEPLATVVQQKVAGEFARLDGAMQRTANKLLASGLTGGKVRIALADLCKTVPYAINCAAVDTSGKMVTMEPEAYRRFEGTDISGQDQVKSIRTRHQPVLSGLFRAVEGFEAIDLEYPVMTPEGKYLGSVSLLFKPESLFRSIAKPLTQGKPAHIWVMEKKGRIIYDDYPAQIGLNLFEASVFKSFPQLQALGRRVVAEQEGYGHHQYKISCSGEVVNNAVAWKTVSLYGTEWHIMVSSQE